MPITQANRVFGVTTPFGDDTLVFSRMAGKEQLGRLFEYEIDMASEDYNLTLHDALGQNLTVRMELPEGGTRYFNGFISRFSFVGATSARYGAKYRATIRPWFWFLTRTANCRIFQNKTVPDIIKAIFTERGFSDVRDHLKGTYRTWEYCVQYRETDFDFISRLMEQEGIYYYFEHATGKHDLVLADTYSSHGTYPGYAKIPYLHESNERTEFDHIYDWTLTQEIQPGKYRMRDFNFERPSDKLEVNKEIVRPHAKSDMEVYDYPGEYGETGEGRTYAAARIEELQAQYERVHGKGNAAGLACGCLFTLDRYARADQNREYLIVSADYVMQSDIYESGSGGSVRYECQFVAMDSGEQYRSPRTTPKPAIQGPQTAIVVGKAGEEIWTDKYGRVKVQFHWDREGRRDEHSSCWVRVSHAWAGPGWGAICIPRIGQEVIVEFLEGDPDRPIITGRVYNGEAQVPYTLPGEATKSTIKSNSSKGGGGSNELRFEDKKAQEEVYLHAQKDLNELVENNRTTTIKASDTLNVKTDRTKTVEGGNTDTITKDHKRTVKEGNETVIIEMGNRSLTLKLGNEEVKLDKGSRKATIALGNDETAVNLGNSKTRVPLGEYRVEANTVVIRATTSFKLQCGLAALEMDVAGNIKINGLTIASTAIMTNDIKGLMVKINS